MIKHYLDNPTASIFYRLYAYFGENLPAGNAWITNDIMTKALANVFPGTTVTTNQLTIFLSRFEFIGGLQFDHLAKQIKSSLRTEFSCSQNDVDFYYYNNAIAYITELAANTNALARVVTKRSFKDYINKKIYLFDNWQRDLAGQKVYLKNIKDRLRATGALNDNKRRFVFIPQELLDPNNPEFALQQFLHNLVNEYPLVGKLYTTTPWTIVVQLPQPKLQAVKAYLVKNGIYYNDGYEDIAFSGRYFNDMPIINTKGKSDKIDKVSHVLRLISADTLKAKIANVTDTDKHPHTFINASRTLHDNQYFLDNEDIAMYRLTALKSLSELAEILKK